MTGRRAEFGGAVRGQAQGTRIPETGSEFVMMRLLLAGLGASTLLVTTGSPTAPPPSAVPTAPGAAGTLQPAGQPLPPVGDPGTETVETGDFPAAGSPAYLTDVRAAGHETFDRFVLEFEGEEVPSYRVGYVEPPITEDGSGRRVDVAGPAFLEVQVSPASGVDLSSEQPRETYSGRDHITAPGGQVITEAVGTGDFESLLSWTIGLDERVPFGVTTFADPARLVVDVLHQPGGSGGIAPVGHGGTADVAAEATGSPVVLTDVRLGAHDGFDRMVLELAGEGEAGYEIGYTEDPRSAGSGHPLGVPGDATLGITLSNLLYPGDAPEGVQPWDGEQRLEIAGTSVLEALVADTLYEGRYAFYAGLDQQRPFAVARLSDPQRIVIDVLDREPGTGISLGETCTSPAGYAVDHPSTWSVNAGETVPSCSRFSPQDFDVPDTTDVRVAAIAFSVEPVAFDRVTQEQPGEQARRELTVDGRESVRIERTATGEGLWPEGTPSTRYAIRVQDGEDGPRTLVADTVGLPRFDYQGNAAVLDAMIGTLDLDAGTEG
ncbi:AMIN-like domain-containing (lipo)protein [Blastococcus sp. SYSU DS0539]